MPSPQVEILMPAKGDPYSLPFPSSVRGGCGGSMVFQPHKTPFLPILVAEIIKFIQMERYDIFIA